MQSQWRCNLGAGAFSCSCASSESGVANMYINYLALPTVYLFLSGNILAFQGWPYIYL